MKHLAKLSMVVALLLTSFACTTDATEDLGVKVGGQTTLTISLEKSRTQLGEKAGEVYPLYWSEGDQISVNGVVSSALTEGGNASASFTFDDILNYPYSVLYPGNAEGKVVFPTSQEYVAGTFASGAVPMYGHAATGEAIQMNYLAGALRFDVSGEDTLSSVVLEAESGYLSGTYTVDCTNGELTAVENSTSTTVTLVFGEGLTLGATATPIYVAVPAGTYGNISVTFYSLAGTKMVAKIDTSSKPISAGAVREFAPFTYSGTALEEEFIIDSKEALIAFAAAPTKSARVVANIDLTGEKWTPIANFGGFTFDGGNFEIKGLTAPLFGSTSGTFKNVKLVDVNIVETANPNVGALARNINASSDLQSSVRNCSASGTMSVNCANYTVKTKNTNTEIAVGGLVGYARGVKFSDCKNSINITATQVTSNGNTVAANASIAGIVGYIDATEGEVLSGDITNCENTGNMVFSDGSTSTAASQLFLAGIFGQSRVGNVNSNISNLTNRGNLTLEKPLAATCYFGGICGHITTQTLTNTKNYGTLIAKGGDYASLQMGGSVGYGVYLYLVDAHNYGTITVDESAVYKVLNVGGVWGKITGEGGYTNDNCSNSGPVSIYGKSTSNATQFRIGGLGGWSQSIVTNCVNHKSGTVTVDAEITIAQNTGASTVGGVVGYKTIDSTDGAKNEADINVKLDTTTSTAEVQYVAGVYGYLAITSPATVNNMVNEGNIFVDGTFNEVLRMGGVVAYKANQPGTGLVNTGDITLAESATIVKDYYVGGIMASYSSLMNSDSRVFCNIKAIGHTGSNAHIGMLTTGDGNQISMPNTHAGGTIQLEKDSVITLNVDNYYNYLFPDGVSIIRAIDQQNGYISSIDAEPQYPEVNELRIGTVAELKAFSANAATTNKNVVLTADIDMTGEEWTPIEGFGYEFDGKGYTIKGLTAPLFGEVDAAHITGVHLTDVNIKAVNQLHTGAVVSWIKPTSGSRISNCSASGKIVATFNEEMAGTTATIYVGGVCGRCASTEDMVGLVNYADIEIKGTCPSPLAVGGAACASGGTVKDCTNLGTINVDATCKGILYLGGVVRYCAGMENCVNGSKDDTTGETAKVVISGTYEAAIAVGGLVESASKSIINSHNYANIYFSGNSTGGGATDGVQLCGLARMNRENNVEHSGCSNHGDMILSGSSATFFTVGGFVSRHFQSITYRDCHNYGDIIVKAEANVPDVFAGGWVGTCDDTGEVCNVKSCSNRGNISVFTSSATRAYLGGACGKIEAGQLLIGTADVPSEISENYGDILYDAENSKSNVYIGGVTGLLTDNLTYGVTAVSVAHRIAHFINHGDITVNGICGTTQVGGMVGRHAKGTGKGATFHFALVNSRNKGNITVNATVKTSDCAIGGLMGFLIHTYSSVGGNWINEGKLTFTGAVEVGRLLVGGYAAATDKAFSGKSNTIYNFGDIEITGTMNSASNNRIGGLFGQMNKSFANCHVFCNIATKSNENVGMLTGCARNSTTYGTNCSVGGAILGDYNVEDETYKTTPITSDNYFNYMYGSGANTNWGTSTTYDDCTVLTAKPVIE